MSNVTIFVLSYLFIFAIADLRKRKIEQGKLFFVLLFSLAAFNFYNYKIVLPSLVSAVVISYIFEKLDIWGRGDTYVIISLSMLLPYTYLILLFTSFGMIMLLIIAEDKTNKEIFKDGYPYVTFLFISALLYFMTLKYAAIHL